jgi:hypothetical protein
MTSVAIAEALMVIVIGVLIYIFRDGIAKLITGLLVIIAAILVLAGLYFLWLGLT